MLFDNVEFYHRNDPREDIGTNLFSYLISIYNTIQYKMLEGHNVCYIFGKQGSQEFQIWHLVRNALQTPDVCYI